jgi:hypothetical protein
LFLAPRTVFVDGDHQAAAGLRRPRPQPGTEDPVENIGG